MMFDIHRPLTNEHGELDEDVAGEFEAELMQRFADSPEATPILERTGDLGWAGSVLEYGRIYEGVTVTTMGKRELSRVLLDVFPRKVSCEPSSAPEIVEELRSFWSFVRREFGLLNADECLAILDEEMSRTMERELADPRNFGMAKSFMMGGMAAGFDMTTEEGMGAFMRAYNTSLPAAARGPAPAPGRLRPPTQAERNKKKAQRKAQRVSRRKSR
ncbi:hypothetical protein [Sorangium sp. So ce1000]|uniref:hypothetical protein n=1 Tax=Sorangium sp. So ce1000 TaxID=3133325 RepID=UPI003F616837